MLDGRRRFDVPVTLILDPLLALIVWVHFAPPIGDMPPQVVPEAAALERRVPVREVLAGRGRAADPDGRDRRRAWPAATRSGSRSPASLAIADQLLDESAGWLWIGGRIPDTSGRTSRGEALLERYRAELGELAGSRARMPSTAGGRARRRRDAARATDSPADLARPRDR